MEQTTKPKRLNVSIDLRLITILLLAVIIAMLAMWRPWSSALSNDRTVRVTGEATVKAEPDEFVFYPNYQFKNANKEVALAELTKKSDEVVNKLKEMGLASNKIKTNANGNDYHFFRDNDDTFNYTLSLTVTATNKDQAQQVQDYLITTQPLGSVSPQPTFSKTLRNRLEAQARDEATKDARAKADQSAQNLGFKVAKVKSVEDGAGFGDVMPLGRGAVTLDAAASPEASKLNIQAGENEINYNVTVTYFVR